MKKLSAFFSRHFTPLVLLMFFGVLFTLLFVIFYFAWLSSGTLSGQDNTINLIFMMIGFVLSLGIFISLFISHHGSRVISVLLLGLYVTAFALTKAIFGFGHGLAGGAVFYLLGFLSAIGTIVFYILKALDGDSDWRFWAFAWVTVAFLLFGGIGYYSIFDAYGHLGDVSYWGGLSASRLVIYLSICASTISSKCDFDPNPILLDEFGNPIDEKKTKAPAKKAK